ncbi:MAG: CarD family transcriptional regulator [Lachnospiraceae bacterium]|nr:CarD family transcriptional regulator [Lachnospiraceae bacterium]
MFKKGDYIVYGTTGVCEVMDVTTIDMEGAAKGRLYYILAPHHDKGGKVFTPVDNVRVPMRAILTQEEAARLIEEIPRIEELWIMNDKMREESYKTAMKSADCREWIKIIKTLYLRKQKRIAQGKKTTSMDERYLKLAEENLYSELSIPLGIPKERMAEYIASRIESAEMNE